MSRTRECKGENGQQSPASITFFDAGIPDPLGLGEYQVREGELSYNTWVDLERLSQTATHIAAGLAQFGRIPEIALVVKHGNACGAAVGADPITVLQKMITGDLQGIFGGVIMLTFPVGEAQAECLRTYAMPEGKRRIIDAIVAPAILPEAFAALKRRGSKICRLLENPALQHLNENSLDSRMRRRYVRGGELIQSNYTYVPDLQAETIYRQGEPTLKQQRDAIMAWAIGSTSNSNTITLVKNGQLIGNGVGQQARYRASRLAVGLAQEGGHDIHGAAAYSDSFFPANDGAEILIDAGVTTIFTSSGSLNDDNIKRLCIERGVNLIMVPDAEGRGFFNH